MQLGMWRNEVHIIVCLGKAIEQTLFEVRVCFESDAKLLMIGVEMTLEDRRQRCFGPHCGEASSNLTPIFPSLSFLLTCSYRT